ncbi:MAG: ABC transporter ATP-binding protein [Eikenella sp.]|nr:ABC transporter ATP-binding protein [Eikenella sp.]
MSALQIRDARKTYANGFTALKGLSFEVEAGEFFALLGPNGAGKTTLISAIAGLSRLSGGGIRVMDCDVVKQSDAARRLLGVVPQELVFDPFFTVREALRIQSGYFGIRKNDAWIDELLHQLGLADKADTNTRNLSGGMKRRVMVAQALVHRPPVIILDEPTAGVDVELRHSLWAFMQSLNRQGHTIILTTHYLEEAEQYCNRIAVMRRGELVALDQTERLLRNDQGVRVQLRLSAPLPLRLRETCIHDAAPEYILRLKDYNQIADILGYLKVEQITVEHLAVLEKDLEQVFISLTAGEDAA